MEIAKYKMSTFTFNSDNTFSEQTRKDIVKELYQLLDDYSIETYPAEHRSHLGASIIGDACSRKLWYNFRWVKLEEFEPRMRRLFNRGHLEEPQFQKLLSWMGFAVRNIDLNTNKQYCFSAHNGHYGGSGDSIVLLPWFNDIKVLAEFKTHNLKSFTKLKDQGLKISKPMHWAQMCSYGLEFKVKEGLYCAINKDTDEIYFDFLALDWNYAQQLKNKAADIINSKIPPPRLSDNPSYFECKYCDKSAICHDNKPVDINCRSCKMSSPIEKGEWFCSRYQQEIPKEFLSKGCSEHVSINA